MFTTLLESRAPRARRTGGTTISAFVHGVLIAAGIAVTTQGNAAPLDKPKQVPIQLIHVDPKPTPPEHVQSQPHTATPTLSVPRQVDIVITVPTITPTSIPPISTGPEIPAERIGVGGPPPGTTAGPTINTAGIVDVAYVERPPAVLGSPRPPRYPQILRDNATYGNVVIRFVIDTLGRAEMGDITVMESTHALFTDAVKSALVDYRFTPGEVAGRKVRTLVQMPFVFSVR